ncbi:MAG: hypothetical protein Q8933_02770 [Bacteroidota bacterium]|nr:hypothetical protein [Bacteroidota bacterium]MDP4192030.1 hypothetical protein [Bacteroidota bacterium]MDP4194691.1 hypothetical protein [Bacteroidota bacterium]
MKKQKIITYLLIASFILLVINIVVDKIVKQLPKEPEKTDLTPGEISERFENVVREFGIDKDWIKSKTPKEKTSVSDISSFEIRIPQGLPVAVVLNELNRTFLDENVTLTSKETTKGKITTLKILSNKNIMLQADFIPDATLTRKTANLGFIIDDIDKISDKKVDEILSLPESFAFSLVPSDRSEKLKQKILASSKEYVVLFNDDIDEVRFKLSPDYNDKRLKGSIRNILGSFSESKLYIIDEKSDLFKSSVNAILEKDFDARKLKLFPMNSFVTVKGKNEQDLQSLFSYYCQSSNSSGNKVFLISADDFIELKSVLETFRKRGYRFVFPSSLKFGVM